MLRNHAMACRRLLALLLMLAMLPIYAAPALGESAQTVYGVVTGGDVKMRQRPSASAGYWETLPRGWVMKLLDHDTAGWYHIKGYVPSSTKREYEGYIMEEFFRQLTAEETAQWIANPTQGTIKGTTLAPTATPTPPAATATPTPTAVPTGAVSSNYVITTASGVSLRVAANSTSAAYAELPASTVLAVVSYQNGWYYVSYQKFYGYVNEQYVRKMTANEVADYLKDNTPAATATPTVTPTSAPAAEEQADQFIKSLSRALNVRSAATTASKALGRMTLNQVVRWKSKAVNANNELWYQITWNNQTAFVMGQFVEEINVPDTATATPSPTPVPGASGYLMTLSNGLNIRTEPSTGAKALGRFPYGSVMPWTSTVVNSAKETWYQITYEGQTAYIMGKYLKEMTAAEYAAWQNSQNPATPTPAPTKTPDPAGPEQDNEYDSGYLYVLSTGLNVRTAPRTSSKSLGKLGYGTVIPWQSVTTVSGQSWYQIDYHGTTTYVMGAYVDAMTVEEYLSWLAIQNPSATSTPTPTPTPAATASASPKPTSTATGMSDVAYTVKNNIFIRKQNTMKSTSLTKIYKEHSYMVVLGGPVADKNGEDYIWYNINYQDQYTGYIRGDLIHVMSNAEWEETFGAPDDDEPVATPVPAQPEEGQGAYVKYTQLRKGSTGSDVTKMQQALYEQGYLDAAQVNGQFLSSTELAIKSFQKDNGLTVDGIAGQITLSTLFNTAVADYTIYPVEKVTWAEANKAWARGAIAVVTDVNTGLSFKVKRWAGGLHADVEPLTAEDTAVMCQVYSVSEAQEINEKNLYQRHPLWVTIDGRTFAASMYGVPHNYPKGDTIPDNDYNGQFCIHFVNSKTHNTETVDSAHQAAIDYAYNNAPSKK